MNIDDFAEYMRLQGHRIVRTQGGYWHEYRPFFYMAVPTFKAYDFPKIEIQTLRWRKAWGGAMYTCSTGGNGGTDYCLITDPSYNLYSLTKKARNQTRQGLQKCQVGEVSWDMLEKDGLAMNRDALQRQGRRSWNPVLTDAKLWSRRMQASAKFPDIKAWGAIAEDRLISYTITARIEDDAVLLSTMSLTQYLHYRPNNALIYTIVESLFREGARRVSYGVVPQEPELLHFKQSMGFQIQTLPHVLDLNPIVHLIAGRMEVYRRLHNQGLQPKQQPADDQEEQE